MTVVEPIGLLNTIEIDYTVTTSTDNAIAEWDPAKADYTLGDEVKVAAQRTKYKLAADTVAAGTVPSENPAIWISSPMVEFAMFDYNNEYASTFLGNFAAEIPDASRVDTLYFEGIDGETITVTSYDGSDVVIYTITENIYDWDIPDFHSYLFPKEPTRKNKLSVDIFDIFQSKIRVEISGANTECRYLVAGLKDPLGITLRDGIGYSQNNFYTNSRDAWGNIISTNSRIIEDVSLPVLDYNADVNIHANKTSRLFGRPCLWLADDRDRANVEFDFINIFGILVSNSITPGASVSEKTLKIEGK